MNDIPIDDIMDISARIMDWRIAYGQIQQYHQHSWRMDTFKRVDAQAAIVDAWELIDDLRLTATRMEWQTKRATMLLKDAV
jgi:hypothetical protein